MVRAGKVVDWGRIRESRREGDQDRKRMRGREVGEQEKKSQRSGGGEGEYEI
jgi:hypothetical protein